MVTSSELWHRPISGGGGWAVVAVFASPLSNMALRLPLLAHGCKKPPKPQQPPPALAYNGGFGGFLRPLLPNCHFLTNPLLMNAKTAASA
jgi:hypothetical protein